MKLSRNRQPSVLFRAGEDSVLPVFLRKYPYKMLKMLQVTEKIIYFATLIVCQCAKMAHWHIN